MTVYPLKFIIQWALEQHRFELHRSTYTWIFFNIKYYSTTQSEVGSRDAEPWVWRISVQQWIFCLLCLYYYIQIASTADP